MAGRTRAIGCSYSPERLKTPRPKGTPVAARKISINIVAICELHHRELLSFEF